jgi:antitoxin component YwqK of YwqJK toxin-antitoxin module
MKTANIILCTMLLMACGNKKVEKNYPGGAVMESYSVNKEGQKDGTYTAFFEGGKVRETVEFEDGKMTGKRTIYFENGKPEIEELYTGDGKLNGPYRVYYPQGGLQLEKTYTNDKITGVLKVYYPNGAIKEEVTMSENEENGPFTEYYLNGAIHWKGTYLNGDNEYGILYEYDSLGGTKKIMKCDTMAICRTIWKPGMPVINVDTVKI